MRKIVLFIIVCFFLYGCGSVTVNEMVHDAKYKGSKTVSLSMNDVQKNIVQLFDKCSSLTSHSRTFDGSVEIYAKSAAYFDYYALLHNSEGGGTKIEYYVDSVSIFNQKLYIGIMENAINGHLVCPQ